MMQGRSPADGTAGRFAKSLDPTLVCSTGVVPTKTTMSAPAVILLSGGLDSATAAAIAREQGFRLHALSLNYGQRHKGELDAARRVARSMGIEPHVVLSIDLRAFGGSALTSNIDVPKTADGSLA